jgi:hypothetical protein
MGLDLWFRADVIRILAALASAGSDRHPAYHAALRDVGLAFGLHEADHHRAVIVSRDTQPALGDGEGGQHG